MILLEHSSMSKYEHLTGVYRPHVAHRSASLLSMTPPGTTESPPDQRLLTCSNKHAKWAGVEPWRRGPALFSVAFSAERGGCGCSRALIDNFPPFFDPQRPFIIRAFWSLFAKQERVAENEKRQLLFRIQSQFLVLNSVVRFGLSAGSKCYWHLIQPTYWFLTYSLIKNKQKNPPEIVWSMYKNK